MSDQRLQAGIQAVLDELVASGTEIGLQGAVIQHGRLVADLVTGIADPGTGVAVSTDTLFYAARRLGGRDAQLLRC